MLAEQATPQQVTVIAKYEAPADRLELYESLVASVEGADRKGAKNPYTSRNGYMTS